MRIGDICSALGGRLLGDPGVEVDRIASLEGADSRALAVLSNPRFHAQALRSKAGVVVVSESFAADRAHEMPCPLIAVPNPLLAVVHVIELLWQPPQRPAGLSDLAFVHPEAQLGAGVSVMPFAYVGKARIGARSRIFPFTYIDDDVAIGEECEIRPSCTLMNGTRLGDRVLLQPGAQLGADGFGYATDGARHRKIPQIGGVEIGSDVEIGALSAVDRAALDVTRIGRGTKIDNQVQIGHNVQVGEDVILCGQVGIAGSTTVGDRSVVAGKVGIADHIHVGHDTRIGAASGVIFEVPNCKAYSGYPAIPHDLWLRTTAEIKRLDHNSRRLRALERRLREVEARCGIAPAAAGNTATEQEKQR